MGSLYGGLIAIAVVLGTFGWLAQTKPTALVAVFAMGFSASILVLALQTRLMDVAHEGQSLAASLNHSTLNIANALEPGSAASYWPPVTATNGRAASAPALPWPD